MMVTKIIGTTAYMKKYAICVVNTATRSQHSYRCVTALWWSSCSCHSQSAWHFTQTFSGPLHWQWFTTISYASIVATK